MRLRLRNKDQVHIITSLNEKSKMIELRQEIQRINGVSPAYQELKTGFPPKVCGANDEVTLDKDAVISSPVENGYAVLREMADDNSCLFRAIEVAQKLRQNPVTYSDIILGKSRNEYCKWIAQKNSWGGAIEIRSVDVGTGRIDKYDYDAVALTPMISADKDYDQTIFEISDQSILNGAISIANKMKKLHKYTYTANFTLRCGQCEKGLVGDKEAVQHAKDTGHTNFVEYN
ncbi:9866_t:CDS:10 [Entrophospora sp. SA101]|nr:9866_t:CDS:10 [Entrophospora sp. SA101]